MKYKAYAVSAYHSRVFLARNLDCKKLPILFSRHRVAQTGKPGAVCLSVHSALLAIPDFSTPKQNVLASYKARLQKLNEQSEHVRVQCSKVRAAALAAYRDR